MKQDQRINEINKRMKELEDKQRQIDDVLLEMTNALTPLVTDYYKEKDSDFRVMKETLYG